MAAKKTVKPAQKPRKKILDVTKVGPLVRGLGDELAPFAEAHVIGYETSPSRPVTLDGIMSDVGADVEDAGESFDTNTKDPAAHRASLVRLVARGIALLALDELNRGSKTIEREMNRLGKDGYPKRAPKARGERRSRR